MFSGFAASYGTKLEEDPFLALYERAKATDGVDYIGPLAQPDLAGRLMNAAALAYPSTFAETSCIAVLEAMASGAMVVTTALGALPETTNGFSRLTEYETNPAQLSKTFAAAVVETLKDAKRNPDSALKKRAEQIGYIRANYTWPARAREWQAWLSDIVRQSHT